MLAPELIVTELIVSEKDFAMNQSATRRAMVSAASQRRSSRPV
jgi:hypothetical protein